MSDRNLSDPMQDPERTAIMIGVGECLSAWSMVEHNVALIFSALMVGADANQVLAAFSAVNSFEIRLDMLTSIIERDQDVSLRASWNSIKNKLDKLYGKRHRVAHFTVLWYPQEATHRLVPFFSMGKSNMAPLTSNDLMIRAESFHHAAHRLSNIRAYVLHRQGRDAGEIPPGADPARWLQNQFAGAQTPKEKSPPDQSSPD